MLGAGCSAESAAIVTSVVPDAAPAVAPAIDAGVPDARMVGITCPYGAVAGPPPASLRPPATDLPAGSLCDDDGFCWLSPLPSGTWWNDIAAAGTDDIWIGGFGRTALHFDGRRWTQVATPLGDVLGIWAAAEDDVWLVGDAPQGSVGIAHWDGSSVTLAKADGCCGIEDVWGSAANDVYAVSVNGIRHWDGAIWSELPQDDPAEPSGAVVAGASASDVWIAGSHTWRGTGSSWSQVGALDSLYTWGLAAIAPGDLWVGSSSRGFWEIDRLDGDDWTPSFGRELGAEPRSLAAGGPDDVWVVGWGAIHEGYLAHNDGVCWTELPPTPTWLSRVRSLRGIGDFAVGQSGGIFQLHPEVAPGWTDLRVGPTANLRGVWASGAANAWAVGERGLALHFDGTSVTPVATGVDADLADAWGTGPDDVWAVGSGGTVIRFDGTAWSRLSAPVTSELSAVFTSRAGEAWIAGEAGTLIHFAGGEFFPIQPPGSSVESYFTDLHGTGPNDVWLVAYRNVWHFDGAAWSQVVVTTDDSHPRVWALAPNDVWLSGDYLFRGNNDYLHYDGNGWSERYEPPSADTWMFPRPGQGNSFALDPDTLFIVSRDGALERKTAR